MERSSSVGCPRRLVTTTSTRQPASSSTGSTAAATGPERGSADRLAIAPLAAGVSLAIGLQALVLVWHGLAPSPVSAYLLPLMYGLACGFPTPVLILMQSRRFGTRHFGAIQGAILLVQSAVSVLVPLGLGLCFDLSGQYRWGLCAAAALLLGAAALAWRLRRLPAGLRTAHASPSLA